MFKKKRLIIVVLIALLAVAFVGWGGSSSIVYLYNNVVLDNEDHFLSCEELPPLSDVTQVVEEHQDTIESIEKINPGQVFVVIESQTCPGKADLMFNYGSHRDRVAIEELIAGETFFGIPYRLRNR